MNDKHLNSPVKNYYQGKELAPDKLEQLLDLANSTNNHNSDTTSNNSQGNTLRNNKKMVLLSQNIMRYRLSIAASVFLFVLIALQVAPVNFFYNKEFNNKELAIRVSEEIALNHNKQLAIEFNAKSFAELRKQMTKLDFSPISSSRLENAGLNFLGARYCSIQGQLAAQIKLANKDGSIQTLYQTQLNNKLQSLPEKYYVVDGVRIKQWQEKGLFFGLATAAE